MLDPLPFTATQIAPAFRPSHLKRSPASHLERLPVPLAASLSTLEVGQSFVIERMKGVGAGLVNNLWPANALAEGLRSDD